MYEYRGIKPPFTMLVLPGLTSGLKNSEEKKSSPPWFIYFELNVLAKEI